MPKNARADVAVLKTLANKAGSRLYKSGRRNPFWRRLQRDAQRKRDGAPGGGPSEPKKVLTPAQTTRRATLAIMVFWLVVMAVLYVVFDQLEQRKKIARTPQMNAAGELVIERGRDGHFRLPGTVNGRPVQFLVDTGASLVSVSEAFAREAGLSGGQSATFHTANGTRPRRPRFRRWSAGASCAGGRGPDGYGTGPGAAWPEFSLTL